MRLDERVSKKNCLWGGRLPKQRLPVYLSLKPSPGLRLNGQSNLQQDQRKLKCAKMQELARQYVANSGLRAHPASPAVPLAACGAAFAVRPMAQRPRGPGAQRHRGPAAERPSDPAAQIPKLRSSAAQSPESPAQALETQRPNVKNKRAPRGQRPTDPEGSTKGQAAQRRRGPGVRGPSQKQGQKPRDTEAQTQRPRSPGPGGLELQQKPRSPQS